MSHVRFFVCPLTSLILCAGVAHAADVSVKVQRGTLVVTGTNAADAFAIDQDGLVDPREFRVSPEAGITINGEATPQTFGGVRAGVRVVAGGGGDSISLTAMKVNGDVRVECGGSGTCALSIYEFESGGDCRVESDGAMLDLDVGDCRIGGALVVVGSALEDSAELGPNLIVKRATDLRLGAGDDDASVYQCELLGGLRVRGDAGEDDVNVTSSQLARGLRIEDSAGPTSVGVYLTIVRGATRVDLGDDDDALVLTFADLAGDVVLRPGDGTNTFEMSYGTVSGDFDLAGGNGIDTTQLYPNVTCDGDVLIRGGEGTNTAVLGESSFNGAVAFTGGDGVDTLNLVTAAVRGATRVRLGGAPAMSANFVQLSTTSFGGNIVVRGGDGLDALTMTSANARAKLLVATGAGIGTAVVAESRVRHVEFRGGPDDDVFGLQPGTTVIGDARFNAGDGKNSLSVIDATVGDDLEVKAGNGDDTLTLNAIIGGAKNVDLGGGANVGG